MQTLTYLAVVAAVLINIHVARGNDKVTCERNYDKIGCFAKNVNLYPKETGMIITFRDKEGEVIDWHNYNASLHSMTCQCSKKAKEMNMKYFAIGYYGECWAGIDMDAFESWIKKPTSRSNGCVNGRFEKCNDGIHEHECTGIAHAEYLYKFRYEAPNPVDGGYSVWTDFTDCSETCGNGTMTRERTCTNPEPENGGQDCSSQGETTEILPCKVKECPVDGKFSKWSDYGECTKTCGTGSQTRTRKCDSPAPAHGGEACDGSKSETKACNTLPCPVDGKFSSWSSYGPCSGPCGSQISERKCNNPIPANGGNDCVGNKLIRRKCNQHLCIVDYVATGKLSLRTYGDAGRHYEPYGYLDIGFGSSVPRFRAWYRSSGNAASVRLGKTYEITFKKEFKEYANFLDKQTSNKIVFYGYVKESDSSSGDDLIASYNGYSYSASYFAGSGRTTTFRGDGYAQISLKIEKD